jgi:hypothetical protein
MFLHVRTGVPAPRIRLGPLPSTSLQLFIYSSYQSNLPYKTTVEVKNTWIYTANPPYAITVVCSISYAQGQLCTGQIQSVRGTESDVS